MNAALFLQMVAVSCFCLAEKKKTKEEVEEGGGGGTFHNMQRCVIDNRLAVFCKGCQSVTQYVSY